MTAPDFKNLEDLRFQNRTLISWYWRVYVRRVVPLLALVSFFMILEGASLGMFSYMVKPMFDDVFVGGQRSQVVVVGLIIFSVFVARAAAGMLNRWFMAKASRTVSFRMQRDLLNHLIKQDDAFFNEYGPGTLIERVRGDGSAAVGIISTTLSAIGRDVVAVIALFSVAMSVDWLWTLIAFLGVPIVALPVIILQRILRNTSRLSRRAAGRITTNLDEILHGIRLIKLNRIEEREAGKFTTNLKEMVRLGMRNTAASSAIPALMDVVAGVGFLGVVTYGGFQIIDGEKTIGEFMSFFTAIGLMFEPVRRLAGLTGAWQAALVSLERVYGLFQVEPKIVSPEISAPLPSRLRQSNLSFDKVNFRYGDKQVLTDISFVAEAGKTTAFVGASGAGKTTLFNLIVRLVDPTDGQIYLADVPVQSLALNDLRDAVTVVAQESHILDDTIGGNVTLGNETSQSDIDQALDRAHVSEFLADKPAGLEARTGPRGTNLSGGQRQRIAIARALLRDTPILLLDEATSALDTESERLVQSALENLSEDRTTLVIAHRLSTIRNADKIIVMDKGKIVDTGTHDELIAKDGLYAHLCRLQFADKQDTNG